MGSGAAAGGCSLSQHRLRAPGRTKNCKTLCLHHCQSRTSWRAAALLDQELVMLEGSEPALERWPCSCSDRAPSTVCVMQHRALQWGCSWGAANSCFGWDQATLEAFERQSCKEQEPGRVSEGLSRDWAEASAPPCCH